MLFFITPSLAFYISPFICHLNLFRLFLAPPFHFSFVASFLPFTFLSPPVSSLLSSACVHCLSIHLPLSVFSLCNRDRSSASLIPVTFTVNRKNVIYFHGVLSKVSTRLGFSLLFKCTLLNHIGIHSRNLNLE